jgi:hypothetical protein
MEQFGAGSRAEGVEALAEPALELIGSHSWRLRRPGVAPLFGVPNTFALSLRLVLA